MNTASVLDKLCCINSTFRYPPCAINMFARLLDASKLIKCLNFCYVDEYSLLESDLAACGTVPGELA